MCLLVVDLMHGPANLKLFLESVSVYRCSETSACFFNTHENLLLPLNTNITCVKIGFSLYWKTLILDIPHCLC